MINKAIRLFCRTNIRLLFHNLINRGADIDRKIHNRAGYRRKASAVKTVYQAQYQKCECQNYSKRYPDGIRPFSRLGISTFHISRIVSVKERIALSPVSLAKSSRSRIKIPANAASLSSRKWSVI